MAPQRYSATPHPIVQRPFVWEVTLGDDAFLVPVSPPLAAVEAFSYGFPLRPYQRQVIEATEAAISTGQREMLLAMATGLHRICARSRQRSAGPYHGAAAALGAHPQGPAGS
jgi:hypothetical protein